jgi:hypothetical protein
MEFPRFVFRSPGARTFKPGITYDYRTVTGPEEMDAALACGWSATRDEALNPAEKPKVESKAAPKEEPVEPVPADDPLELAKMDMDQLRQVAEQLGIEVDKRWGEKRLRAEIEKAAE